MALIFVLLAFAARPTPVPYSAALSDHRPTNAATSRRSLLIAVREGTLDEQPDQIVARASKNRHLIATGVVWLPATVAPIVAERHSTGTSEWTLPRPWLPQQLVSIFTARGPPATTV